jgi:NADH-quinone oxidoreductase subunit C
MDNITEKSVTLRKLEEKFPEYVLDFHSDFGDDTAIIRKEGITEICLFLRDNPELSYNFLMDLTAVDYLGKTKKERFEVVYHFYSLKRNARLRLKAPVSEEDCAIDSITSLWECANWAEREAWDLYGIKFRGHPELKRILLYEPFEGHPLRKDYPVKKRQPLIGPEN